MYKLLSVIVLAAISCLSVSCGSISRKAGKKQVRYEFTHGKSVLLLGNGMAVAPTRAPERVHRAVIAGNRLQGKPYLYGGGHARVEDRGYDCSGTVSYALIHAGLLRSPMPSSGFKKYGKRGPGKWITIYARDGHTFMTIGGLRLDTGYGSRGEGPRWLTRPRPANGYTLRHPPGL